jgi:hypothetical protein
VIPDKKLSSVPQPSEFLVPDDAPSISPILDYELGGVALNDPSQGLQVKTWRIRLVGNDVRIDSPPTVPETTLFTLPGVTEISLTFDQNMRPVIAYVQNNQPVLYWYDTLLQTTVFQNLPADVVTPRVSLDDKRPWQVGASDVILAYVRNNNLYFAAQRDRFGVEYLLQENVNGKLIRIGMNQGFRLQFWLEEVTV